VLAPAILTLSASSAAAYAVPRSAAHTAVHGTHRLVPSLSPLWSAAPPVAMLVALLVAAAVGLALLGRRRKRAGLLLLAAVVGLFTFEAAVHSVHHLTDPGSAALCPVLTASKHVSWAAAETPDAEAPTWDRGSVPLARTDSICLAQSYRPHAGRAPPPPPPPDPH
jgi:hypothetical protein